MKSTPTTQNVKYTKLSIGKFTLEQDNISAKEYLYQQYDKKLNMYFPTLPYAVELPMHQVIAKKILLAMLKMLIFSQIHSNLHLQM